MPVRNPSRLIAGVTALVAALAACSSSSATRTGAATGDTPATGSTSPTATPTLAPGTSSPSTTSSTSSTSWTGYHANDSRTGAVTSDLASGGVTPAWTTSLGAAVYGQPLAADGRIFAATEANRVVALSPATGAVLWSVSVGQPLTDVDSVAGCGDIDPLGITSTPVLDPTTDVLYVVGEVSDGRGHVHHELEGLAAATGKVVLADDVDPPLPAGETADTLLQRASLVVANDRVYVGYGGNDGDCGQYHGWVVGVFETGSPRTVSFEVAADGQGGAIWEAGGAPAVDAGGDLYVTTGNANPDPPQGGPDPKQYTESVVKLSPTLVPIASYKDVIAGGDEDLATGNPVLLPGGEVFAVGKTDVGYVLRQSDLGKVASIPGVCGSDPDGGPAYDATTRTLFVPCKGGGIQEIDLATNALGPRLSGANGAPILVGADLWAAQYPNGTVTAWNAATGARIQSVRTPGPVATFASPSTGLGLLLVGTRAGVTAFR